MTASGAIAKPAAGLWPRIEISLVVVFLILFSAGLVQRLVTGEQDVDGNAFLRVMWLPVYAGVFALSLTRLRELVSLGLRMPFLILLLMLTLASVAWSIDPGLTLRRSVSVVATTLFALFLVVRYDAMTLLRILGGVWLFLAAISFLAGLLVPGFGRQQEVHVGAWRGFWFVKNSLGGQMARAALIFMVLALFDPARRRIWLVGLGLSVALVILSTSATALLGLILALAMVAAGALFQRGPVHAVVLVWSGASLAGMLAMILLLEPQLVLEPLGKDTTLTGRTDIWGALIESISQRPWLGYGYGAYWAPDSEPAHWVRVAVNWEAPSAHNGWLELCIALGYAGLALFILHFALTVIRAVAAFPGHRAAIFAAGFLIQFMLFSSSESLIIARNHMVWILYVIVAGYLARGFGAEGSVQPRNARRGPGSSLRVARGDSFAWRGRV